MLVDALEYGKSIIIPSGVISYNFIRSDLMQKQWLAKMNVEINEVKKRPYPLPDNSKFYELNVYAITGITPYDPEIRIGQTEEIKLDRANFTMERFFMGDY